MKRLIYIIINCCALLLIACIDVYTQPQFTIEKLPFNSPEYDEFSPAYYKDGIVFSSNRKNDVIISYSDTSEKPMKMIDLYFANMKDNKKWRTPEIMSNGLTTLFNDGPASFYNNGLEVAFTRNINATKKFGSYSRPGNNAGIFFAEYYNGSWINIKPFEYNSTDFNVMHPALSNDGSTMYFASDMPGGYGGFDLYVTYFKSGRWSKPLNLGPNINSNKNEAFPFMHSSGRLYFSSKGWNSRGGYDIFFSQQFDEKWLKPQSMKEPFNTINDDFGLIADEYLQSGYFSSNRGKSDDIYSFKSVITDFENCKQQQKNNFCYIFFENGTSEGDVTGSMRYEWDFGDGNKIRAIEAKHCYAKTGKYIVKLNVIDSLTGEIYFSQAQYEHVVEEVEQPFITAFEFANEGDTIKLDAKKSNLKNFRIAKYYWDFGDGLKGIGESVSHSFYLEGVYDVKLQVESTQGKNGIRKACVYKSIAIKKP